MIGMRIMDLDFQTALKYAFLGDEIYRLSKGKNTQIKVYTTGVSDTPVLFTDGMETKTFSSADVVAKDWVAESTDNSV